MSRSLIAAFSIACLASCGACERKTETPPAAAIADPAAALVTREASAIAAEAQRKCGHPVSVFDGSISIDATGYLHGVMKGDDYVEVELGDLDRVVTKATRVQFTLDYPFEKPFKGEVTGPVTMRRIIDAIRGGFRKMYEGTTERPIGQTLNKDVKGAYGQSFHAIGDLVIEGIDLCDDDSLEISIGS